MTIIKKSGLFLLLLSFFTPASVFANAEELTIWLVRHTEKANDGSKNPNLTEKGQAQAALLNNKLLNKNIKAIYSTDYKRTQQTAIPLAKTLGIEIQSYDPKKLSELAASLIEKGTNALVVGHSNTTPELAWLLSKQYQSDIDEEEFNRILIKVQPNKKPATTAIYNIDDTADSGLNISAPVIDANKVHSFSGTFNMLFNQEKMGTATQSVEVQDKVIILKEETRVKAFNINASIYAEVRKSNFAPLKMTMSGKMGVPAALDFQWQNHNSHSLKVTGFTDMARARYKQQGRIDLTTDIPSETMERTAAIMLVPFFKQDASFRFNWFNSYDASSRDIQFIPLGEATVTVPAGTFETRKVKLLGGAPSQVFYISKEARPKVVKIEVVKMPWTYELQNWQAK